jgi:DNA-binding transcriptional LysR family regulator
VDDVEIMIRAAVDGVGLAWASEQHVASHLETGALVRVLED